MPSTGRGRDWAKSASELARLTERRGRPPAYGDTAASETIKLLNNDHAVQDWRDVVERVARPVLMIAGRDSQIWPSEHAEAAIVANPLGRAVIIEDSGHPVSFDQPDRFNDVLLEFLRTQRETLDR